MYLHSVHVCSLVAAKRLAADVHDPKKTTCARNMLYILLFTSGTHMYTYNSVHNYHMHVYIFWNKYIFFDNLTYFIYYYIIVRMYIPN